MKLHTFAWVFLSIPLALVIANCGPANLDDNNINDAKLLTQVDDAKLVDDTQKSVDDAQLNLNENASDSYYWKWGGYPYFAYRYAYPFYGYANYAYNSYLYPFYSSYAYPMYRRFYRYSY